MSRLSPAEINKWIEREIKEATPWAEALKTWGCENDYTIHNLCRGSYIDKISGIYYIFATVCSDDETADSGGSKLLYKGKGDYWDPDVYLSVSVTAKDDLSPSVYSTITAEKL